MINKREWQTKLAKALGFKPGELINLDISIRGDSPMIRVQADLLISEEHSFYRVLQDLQYEVVGMKSEQ